MQFYAIKYTKVHIFFLLLLTHSSIGIAELEVELELEAFVRGLTESWMIDGFVSKSTD